MDVSENRAGGEDAKQDDGQNSPKRHQCDAPCGQAFDQAKAMAVGHIFAGSIERVSRD